MIRNTHTAKARHVAIYVPSLRGGGAERVMVLLVQGFAARGLQVDLVLPKVEGPYLADVPKNVRLVDLGAKRVLTSLPGLVRYLRRERPTAMLSALNHANVVAVAAHRLARVPTRLVVSERNTLSVSLAQATSIQGRLMVHFMRWAYPKADGVLAVSSGVADDLAATIGLSRARIGVVYNPVVSPDLYTKSAYEPQHPWFYSGMPPVILGVGRLTAQKDFATLISAFAELRSQRHVRLLILGEGELRSELEALVDQLDLRADVALPGFTDNPYAYMRRASLYVLSSRYEGLPGALIQAMACGTPVVSTACPSGPTEILQDGQWGRLVPVGDIQALAAAMSATLDDTTHPDVTRRAQDFGMDQAVDGYLNAMRVAP